MKSVITAPIARSAAVSLAALVVGASALGCPSPAATTVDAAAVDAAVLDARTMRGCTTSDPRMVDPEVFVGPIGYGARFRNLIDGATTRIDLQMYLFTVSELSTALINAKNRGVAVRVLLDPDHAGNVSTKAKLMAGGVEVKGAPAGFEFAHAKYMIVDGTKAVVSSGNFNFGALDSERNYGFITRDADDISDLNTIFEADWNSTTFAQTCTRLLVSPYNSRSRLLAHINGAMQQLDVEVFYMTDTDIVDAVKRAKVRGVPVRVILAPASNLAGNAATITALTNLGFVVKVATSFDLHAKLIIADGVAFVGSENMSFTSLGKNREVGALIFEPSQAAIVSAQFEQDWASEPIAP